MDPETESKLKLLREIWEESNVVGTVDIIDDKDILLIDLYQEKGEGKLYKHLNGDKIIGKTASTRSIPIISQVHE